MLAHVGEWGMGKTYGLLPVGTELYLDRLCQGFQICFPRGDRHNDVQRIWSFMGDIEIAIVFLCSECGEFNMLGRETFEGLSSQALSRGFTALGVVLLWEELWANKVGQWFPWVTCVSRRRKCLVISGRKTSQNFEPTIDSARRNRR